MTNAQKTQNDTKTLYERLGGAEGISAIVDDVVDAHMNNPYIKETFLPFKDQPEQLASIKKHTVEFFSAGSGGPAEYNGKDMPTAHEGMNISADEYMWVVDDILMVLNKYNIDNASRNEVLGILWSLKGMIMGK